MSRCCTASFTRTKKKVHIETIAYPGITLVNPTENEAEEGMARGIIERFFHVSVTIAQLEKQCSPWDATPLAEYEHPSSLYRLVSALSPQFRDIPSLDEKVPMTKQVTSPPIVSVQHFVTS